MWKISGLIISEFITQSALRSIKPRQEVCPVVVSQLSQTQWLLLPVLNEMLLTFYFVLRCCCDCCYWAAPNAAVNKQGKNKQKCPNLLKRPSVHFGYIREREERGTDALRREEEGRKLYHVRIVRLFFFLCEVDGV